MFRGSVRISRYAIKRWLATRFAIYAFTALIIGQSFIGLAGLDRGGLGLLQQRWSKCFAYFGLLRIEVEKAAFGCHRS